MPSIVLEQKYNWTNFDYDKEKSPELIYIGFGVRFFISFRDAGCLPLGLLDLSGQNWLHSVRSHLCSLLHLAHV